MMTAMATTFDVRTGRRDEAKLLKVEIEFSDGRRSRNTDNDGRPYLDEPEPGEVRLFERGGGGNEARRSVEWWVTPLPPSGPIAIVIEWSAVSPDPSRVEIDAEPIIEAAPHSQRLWNS
jgi:hypothetical protein